MLKIGDIVNWKGCFGMDAPKSAKVENITITGGGKYGDDVDEVSWKEVYGRNVVVSLDNGHWAYAEQISRIDGEPKPRARKPGFGQTMLSRGKGS